LNGTIVAIFGIAAALGAGYPAGAKPDGKHHSQCAKASESEAKRSKLRARCKKAAKRNGTTTGTGIATGTATGIGTATGTGTGATTGTGTTGAGTGTTGVGTGTTGTGAGTTTGGKSADTTPPVFAGLQSAYYCHPGPVRLHERELAYFTLTWRAAIDDVSPGSQIVYEVYVAFAPGDEYFARATYETPPGVTEYRIPQLLPAEGTYFVVRARDQAGNEDHNTVERAGVNLCV
jgi:hypothetical protein